MANVKDNVIIFELNTHKSIFSWLIFDHDKYQFRRNSSMSHKKKKKITGRDYIRYADFVDNL